MCDGDYFGIAEQGSEDEMGTQIEPVVRPYSQQKHSLKVKEVGSFGQTFGGDKSFSKRRKTINRKKDSSKDFQNSVA